MAVVVTQFDVVVSVHKTQNQNLTMTPIRWDSFRLPNFINQLVIPNTWMTPVSQRDSSEFNSGVFNDSLALESLQRNQQVFIPHVESGFGFFNNQQRYLYSDESIQKVVVNDVLSDGDTTIFNLDIPNQPGAPVTVIQWIWKDGEFSPYLQATQVSQFTSTDQQPTVFSNGDIDFTRVVSDHGFEFIIQNNQLIFNRNIISSVGTMGTETSDEAELAKMELIGTSDGTANQFFHTKFCPIDNTQVLVGLPGSLIEWTGVDSNPTGLQYRVDRERGILFFEADIPPINENIYVVYDKSFHLEYEPEYTTELFTHEKIDTFISNAGFVSIRNKELVPESIELESNVTEVFLGQQGVVFSGRVLSSSGEGVPQTRVTIASNLQVGNFSNGQSSIEVVTDGEGRFVTSYFTSSNLDDLGRVTVEVSNDGSESIVLVPNYIPQGRTFIYQIEKEDYVLGLPISSLVTLYEDYLASEEIFGTPSKGPVLTIPYASAPWIVGSQAGAIKWEVQHRFVHGIIEPTITDSISVGNKKIIATTVGDAVNPHTGDFPAISPLLPTNTVVESGVCSLTFDGVIETPSDSTSYKSLFVVSDQRVTFQASCLAFNKQIVSNQVELEIKIPSTAKGLFEISELNNSINLLYTYTPATTSGVFTSVSLNETTGFLPLGFRITNTNHSLANTLNSVTFLDLNQVELTDL